MRDPKIHAVIALLTHQYVTETEKIARTIVKYQRLFPRKIIVASFIGGEGVEKGREILSKFKIPHYEYPEQAAQILGAIKKCQDWKKTNGSFPNENHPASKKEKVILGKEADRLLKRYCTNLIPSRYFGSFAQAASSADTLSYPLVMKIVSKSFVHKTERSLVRVNIANAKEFLSVLAEWKKLPLHFGTNEGILVQPYLTSGLEVFIGAKRDPLMGPYIIVGLGGIYVESMPKPSVHPLPVSKQQAIRLCSRGPLGKILGSSRGRLLNTKRLVDAILGVSRMMIQEKKVLECDCNPVICTKKDAVVADLRIIVNGS